MPSVKCRLPRLTSDRLSQNLKGHGKHPMLRSRLAICLAAALALPVNPLAAQTSKKAKVPAPRAVEIPVKYRGVYARDHERCKIPVDAIHVPWPVVTGKAVHRDESLCKITAVKPKVWTNMDALTFACAEEGTESVEEEAWSLEFETEAYGNVKVSEQYLVRREIESGKFSSTVSRLLKCGLQAVDQR